LASSVHHSLVAVASTNGSVHIVNSEFKRQRNKSKPHSLLYSSKIVDGVTCISNDPESNALEVHSRGVVKVCWGKGVFADWLCSVHDCFFMIQKAK
jgi:hypothetical protein